MRFVAAALCLLLSNAVAAAAKPPPIATRKDDVVDRLHGVDVPDPYRWLEDADSPEVKAWIDAQNGATRRALDRVPGRAALEKRFWQLYEIGSVGVPVSRPSKNGDRRYFHTRRDGKQNQPVLYVRDGAGGADRALVDVNAERADGTRALDWWFPTDDGARVAYGVSDDGSEESVLRVRDVATGKDLGDEISRARSCSLAWTPDGRAFYYTRYPAPGSVPAAEVKYHRAVYFHRLGDDPAKDRKIFGDGRDMTDWPGVDLSPDGRWLAITVSQGWSKSEVYLVDARAGGPPVAVAAGEPARFSVVQMLDDRLYLFTNSGAPRGRLFLVDPARPARAGWRELVKQSDEVLTDVAYFRGGLAVASLQDAALRLRLYSADGEARGDIPLPGLGALTGLSGARDVAEIFYGFTSLLVPTEIFRVDVAGGPPASRSWHKLQAPVDAGSFEVERVMVTSRDGTRLPLFLAHRKGAKRDGKQPALLTGYGGFDISMLPSWTPSAVPFLEAGGTYALAVLRGGGEYGEDWHRAGMLAQKQNVFDDFIAAAEWLIANHVTSAARLAISGRSNGGLLVGAALTQRPDLFRAVVCGVPLLDMLRYHHFRIAALWIPEYGSPDDPEAFRWLHAYSPYHHVRDGVAYPAVLLHTAASDTRVDAMHARKMTARLQAVSPRGRTRRPVLLREESHAGHGAGKPLAMVIAQVVDEWSFVFAELEVRTKQK
ncbi:MAG TPA: prolyl oligopeptidase family serine peptidase [Polyangia bacterium]|nr:prolyl oligopeptidase family serine peptidase [Polyangia bacterium]